MSTQPVGTETETVQVRGSDELSHAGFPEMSVSDSASTVVPGCAKTLMSMPLVAGDTNFGRRTLDELAKLSSGKYKIEVYPDSQLGTIPEMLSAVQTGSLPEKRKDAVTGHGLRSREDAVTLLEEIERGQGVAR